MNRESLDEVSELKRATRANALARVDELLTSSPDLRQFLINDVPLQGQARPRSNAGTARPSFPGEILDVSAAVYGALFPLR